MDTVKTEHPHVIIKPDVCGGSPIIEGTRITVRLLATLIRGGASPDEIIRTYPHLSLAQVYDALSYYFDHRHEIDQEIEDNKLGAVMRRHDLRFIPHPSRSFGRLVTAEEFEKLSAEEKERAYTWDTLPEGLDR